mmetsp:Transcript_15347/g.22214  ORF Transcript_15347/g.22214 Transcript_15347/m.22214 type:complete len:83 (+) Transcript_15347:1140-1388(+)
MLLMPYQMLRTQSDNTAARLNTGIDCRIRKGVSDKTSPQKQNLEEIPHSCHQTEKKKCIFVEAANRNIFLLYHLASCPAVQL